MDRKEYLKSLSRSAMIERLDYRVRKKIFQHLTTNKNHRQFDRLQNTDWDLLVVLDACRADTLRLVVDWPVESITSPASCTPEWLQAIAEYGIFNGCHVLSGNPQYERVNSPLGTETIEPYWESSWDERLQTTLPEPILDRADELIESTSRGIVAHLQQPHWPYIAQLGGTWELAYDNLGPWKLKNEEITSVQVAMQRGLINMEQAISAYKASVASIWNVLADYIGDWIKKEHTVVITADHGELFGRFREFGFYEHPCKCHLSPLITVPWIEFHPQKNNSVVKSVEDRLRALGYSE